MGDNVGGGSPGDATFLAAALERRRIRDSFVCLCDGQAVNQARSVNVGDEVQLAVGGKSDGQHGRPLEAMFRVRGVYDGKFCERQPRHGGVSSFDQGLTAVVQTRFGLTVMLTSQRMAPWSLAQLESCQLDPKSFQVLTAKGVHSPIAAYRSVCEEFIRVNTPGCTSADLSTFEYQRRRRPMFPFEPSTTWSSDDV
jgi:microcystin degradation protein MlrC